MFLQTRQSTRWTVHQQPAVCINTFTSCVLQDLEQMAMEQDKESNKQTILGQVEGHRKQMLR